MNPQNERHYPSGDVRRPAQRPPQAVRRSAPARAPQQRGSNQTSHSAAPVGGRALPAGLLKLVIGGLIAVMLAMVLQRLWPTGFPFASRNTGKKDAPAAIGEIYSKGPIRINEIMTGNLNTLGVEDESSPDWIEIINIGRSNVDLSGYALSKSANSATVFTFPSVVLAPNECVLVYADSRLREDGEELHAPFRISSKGDTLLLFNADGTAIDAVNIPAMEKDHAYVRRDTSKWEITDQATPGLTNTDESYRALTTKADYSPVIITEIMPSNRTTYQDENGQYSDYIELFNQSGEAVDLTGWHLSDDSAVPRKWTFPSVSLQPGEYMIVFASKQDKKNDPKHLHTNFALSSEGECVVLSNKNGQIMDMVAYDVLKRDQAYSRSDDGSMTTQLAPTPGKANK